VQFRGHGMDIEGMRNQHSSTRVSFSRLRGISLKSRMHRVWSAQRLPLQWMSSSAVVQHGSAAGGINTGSRLLWQQQIL